MIDYSGHQVTWRAYPFNADRCSMLRLALALLLIFTSEGHADMRRMFDCVSAARTVWHAEFDLLPALKGDDRSAPEYAAWNAGWNRIDQRFSSDARRCMSSLDARNLCMLSALHVDLGEYVEACGLKEALPNLREPRHPAKELAASFGLIEAAFKAHRNQCDTGGDEGAAFIASHKIDRANDERLCKALITWFGPSGTRLKGLLTSAAKQR